MSALQSVAGLMATRGDERLAGMLRGAAEEAMRAQGLTLSGADVLVDRRFLEPLSGADRYAAGLAAGKALTLDAAVDAALEGLRSPAGSATTVGPLERRRGLVG